MSWSVLQSAGANKDGGNVLTVTYTTANLSSGSKLIAYVEVYQTTTTAVKDGAGNSFTKLVSLAVPTPGTSSELSLWAMDTPAGDVGTKPTITPTFGITTPAAAMVIQEVSGLLAGNTSAMLDGTAGTNTGTGGTSATSGAYSSGAAGEYLVFLGGDDEQTNVGTWSGTPSGSATYTVDTNSQNTTNVQNCMVAYGNSTHASETATWTLSSMTGNEWGTILVAFKLAASGPATNTDVPKINPGPAWFDHFKPGLRKPVPPAAPDFAQQPPQPPGIPAINPGPTWLDIFKPQMPKPRRQQPEAIPPYFAQAGAPVQIATTSSSTLTVSPATVGSYYLVEVQTDSQSIWCTSISGGNCTWQQIGTEFSFNGALGWGSVTVFVGTATATGSASATLTFNGTQPSTVCVGLPFTAQGPFTLDAQGNLGLSSPTATMPSLTPTAGPGELYFCFANTDATPTAGTTPGYTYFLDQFGNGLVYNANCTSAAQAPVWGSSEAFLGVAVLLKPVPPPITSSGSFALAPLAFSAQGSQTSPDVPQVNPGTTWLSLFKGWVPRPFPVPPAFQSVNATGSFTLAPLAFNAAGSVGGGSVTSTGSFALGTLAFQANGSQTSPDVPQIFPGTTWLDLFKPGMPRSRPISPAFQSVSASGSFTLAPLHFSAHGSQTSPDQPRIYPGTTWLDLFKPGLPKPRPVPPAFQSVSAKGNFTLPAIATATSGPQLSTNPFFTGGSTTGWTGFNGTLTGSTNPPAGCPYPAAAEWVNNGVAGGAIEGSPDSWAASPSTQYTVNAWVYTSLSQVQIGFDWENSGHSFLSTSAQVVNVTPNTWTYVSTVQFSNASAAFGYARVGSSLATGETVWATAIQAYAAGPFGFAGTGSQTSPDIPQVLPGAFWLRLFRPWVRRPVPPPPASQSVNGKGSFALALLAFSAAGTASSGPTESGPFNIYLPGGCIRFGPFSITLPAPKMAMQGYAGRFGPVTVNLPSVVVSLAGIHSPLWPGFKIPALKVSLTGKIQGGAFNITLPAPKTALTSTTTHFHSGPLNINLGQCAGMGGHFLRPFMPRLQPLLPPAEPLQWISGQPKTAWKTSLPWKGWTVSASSTISLSHLAIQYVLIPVSATKNGTAYNPTSDPVQFAFAPTPTYVPQVSDWVSGSWVTDTNNVLYPYSAQCLIGSGGAITLGIGTYIIYIKVSDTPETPVLIAGQLEIT